MKDYPSALRLPREEHGTWVDVQGLPVLRSKRGAN
jgi:hypothetical protein